MNHHHNHGLHLSQAANSSSYCNMTYPLHSQMRVDQAQTSHLDHSNASPGQVDLNSAPIVPQQQHRHQHNQQQQQQHPMAFLPASGSQVYHHQYNHYMQQVHPPQVQQQHLSPENHRPYVQSAPQSEELLYNIHSNQHETNPNHHHGPYEYSPRSQYMQPVEQTIHPSNQFITPATNFLQSQHQQQYNYNDFVVHQQQHHQHEQNMFDTMASFTNTGYNQQQTLITSNGHDNYVFAGGAGMVEQTQYYYPTQQELPQEQDQTHHMDLHPTIKQQQAMARERDSMTDSVQTIGLPSPAITSSSSYNSGQQMPFTQMIHNTQHSVHQHQKANSANANLAPVAQSISISRSKSDLETSNLRTLFNATNPSACDGSLKTQNHHQRSISVVSYNSNQQQQEQEHEKEQSSSFRNSERNQHQDQRELIDMRPTAELNESGSDNLSSRENDANHQDWLDTICRHLIEHMDRFGICVIDNFLGSSKGDLILKEVHQLYNNGQYTKGRLVNNKLNDPNNRSSMGCDTEAIRGDRVIWIDGCEDGCSEINNLIQTLGSVITNSSRLSLYSNNGLDKIVINKRTKAHVACYPRNGTKYIKHVDNPNGDGRVITAIYYINKDWNTKRDGGLLRMYPVGMDEVANIEPLFDRVLFFWSDRRNPHEVLPAYKDRFAITVWYIGEIRP